MATTEEKGQQPNIRFVGKPKMVNGKKVPREPLVTINDGNSAYVLPADFVQQAKGFYHPNAKEIIRLFPQLYKKPIRKGAAI
ncbi:MAG TPA: hypothetical protein VF556_08585 [Pyrinomonadaceae bacterium]|jgi:ribosomal protein L15